MLIISHNDFCPILELHYRLLAKSEYGIDKRYVITFDEIDTPTAKEAAEIRQIEANTDATYVNAGVLAPDEVRQKLREDEDSGYSALEDEEPEEDLFGGSSNEQDPFNMDEWEENKHPRKENGQFGEGGGEKFEDKEQHEKDLKHSYEAHFLKMIELEIDEAEFLSVVSGINKIYDANKNKKKIKYHTMNYIYKVENHGFNNYLFSDKIKNEKIDRNL